MVDVNERALALATHNAKQNGISNAEIYPSDALSGVTAEGFAAILTNPPIRAGKETVFKFYEGAFAKLGRIAVGLRHAGKLISSQGVNRDSTSFF